MIRISVCLGITLFMIACTVSEESAAEMNEETQMQPEQEGQISADSEPENVMDYEDFSFELTWNCYGISSYDSKTGKLVKTSHASHPEDYVTYYTLTDENKARIHDLISSLDPQSYPDEYDPGNGWSEPDMTLILTVHINGKEKTIKAEGIGLSYESDNSKGRKFLSACREISEMLMETEVWQELPDYEFIYE